MRLGDCYLVPCYLPALVDRLVPRARHHIARDARRYGLGVDVLWDGAVAALMRVAVYWDPKASAFGPYDRTAVHRACWRYIVRTHVHHARHGTNVRLEDAGERPELAAPSAEAEAIARDALRRAGILDQHAAPAEARGDTATATTLRAVAAAANAVGRSTRRA